MKIMLFLIMASLLLALGFLLSFFWASKNGQFDDDYTPSVRILFESSNDPNGLNDSNKSEWLE
jgi:cbb3-type cytochrome oxidase maturation protein